MKLTLLLIPLVFLTSCSVEGVKLTEMNINVILTICGTLLGIIITIMGQVGIYHFIEKNKIKNERESSIQESKKEREFSFEKEAIFFRHKQLLDLAYSINEAFELCISFKISDNQDEKGFDTRFKEWIGISTKIHSNAMLLVPLLEEPTVTYTSTISTWISNKMSQSPGKDTLPDIKATQIQLIKIISIIIDLERQKLTKTKEEIVLPKYLKDSINEINKKIPA